MSTSTQQTPAAQLHVPAATDLDTARVPAVDGVAHKQPAVQAEDAARRRPNVGRLLLLGLPILLLAGAFVATSIYRENALYVSTENAQVAGQPVQVGSMNAGRGNGSWAAARHGMALVRVIAPRIAAAAISTASGRRRKLSRKPVPPFLLAPNHASLP